MKLGTYRHYKNNLYNVIAIVDYLVGSANTKLRPCKCVLYYGLADKKSWLRPYAMFNDNNIETTQARFTLESETISEFIVDKQPINNVTGVIYNVVPDSKYGEHVGWSTHTENETVVSIYKSNNKYYAHDI
jgi:hypothetical protein